MLVLGGLGTLIASSNLSAAHEPVAVGMEWLEVAYPSGDFAISMPCSEAQLQQRQRATGSGIACSTEDLTFVALLVQAPEGAMEVERSSPYEAALAAVQDNGENGRVETLAGVAGRKFRVRGKDSEPFGIFEVSEHPGGGLIYLMTALNPDGPVTSLDKVAAEGVAQSFFDTLKLASR